MRSFIPTSCPSRFRDVEASPIELALRRVTGALAAHEDRPAQLAMAEAVANAIHTQRHLVVQAGTGTGKSLGYLVPTLALGTRAVVATATKALQDQLATRDLPLLVEHLDLPVTFAVLKGRSNYICVQRVREVAGAGDQMPADQLTLDADTPAGPPPGAFGREIHRLVAWAATAPTGDRAELSWEPSAAAWAQVSVGPRECPGAGKCPSGGDCFAEAARSLAAEADVVVVNTHLYAAHLASQGQVLPPHDVVIFDEAHELEDIASASLGIDLAPGRLRALARTARPLLVEARWADEVNDAGDVLADALAPWLGRRLDQPLPVELADRLTLVAARVAAVVAALRRRAPGRDGPAPAGEDEARRARAQQAATQLANDLAAVLELGDGSVAWAEGQADAPRLRVAPLDVGDVLRRLLWAGEAAPTGILTSATVPPGIAARLGLPADRVDELDVGSPFDYRSQALLYCPVMPDPRQPAHGAAVADEIVALIEAAEGRTMALFTSWRAMQAAAEAVTGRVPWLVLSQGDLPKPALLERFSTDEHSCLFATMGFWQGVDVPGPALSVVTVDRLPFARPDDPLLQARRERLGRAAFEVIDVPRAATLLAQGTGRLIRTATDRGVIAVLDPRLATARYRGPLIRALPPMPRTRHRHEVEAFLAPLREAR
jgi:ATP-dependent DNA helicase DinG